MDLAALLLVSIRVIIIKTMSENHPRIGTTALHLVIQLQRDPEVGISNSCPILMSVRFPNWFASWITRTDVP